MFLALLALCQVSAAQLDYPTEAAQAEIVTADLVHFLEAYRALNAQSDTATIIQALYIDRASPGLQEYIGRFQLTAGDIARAMGRHPEAYEALAPFLAGMPAWKSRFDEAMARFGKLFPGAMYAPTYLLVADYKGIANASRYGQLIGVERKYTEQIDALLNTIVHELTHFQQAITMGPERYAAIYRKPDNMLDIILREGGAEFITYRLVRQNESECTKLQNYMKDEAGYWKKFQADLENQAADFWLNVTFDDNNKGNPIQLGYGLGYRIVEAYYDQAADKAAALQQILDIEDARAFLEQSGYDPR
jgi:hypothetical protein